MFSNRLLFPDLAWAPSSLAARPRSPPCLAVSPAYRWQCNWVAAPVMVLGGRNACCECVACDDALAEYLWVCKWWLFSPALYELEKHTCTYTDARIHTCAHTHAYTHARARARAHRRTHTHTHIHHEYMFPGEIGGSQYDVRHVCFLFF